MSQLYIYIYKMQDFHFSLIVEQLEILKFDNVCDFRFMFLFCFKSHMFFTMDKDLWFRREDMKGKKKTSLNIKYYLQNVDNTFYKLSHSM